GPEQRLEQLGKQLGMIVTAGSDYHGSNRQDRRLGHTAGKRKISLSYLQGIPGTPAFLEEEY
ncbi:MAG: PHP domain-containing protein, partial [Termitinemataceae bacterium]